MSTKKKEKSMDLHDILLEDIMTGSKSSGQCLTVSFLADKHGVSTSTIYNHIRQMWRDNVPVLKIPRGLVTGSDATKIDLIKIQLKLARRRSNSVLESSTIHPVVTRIYGKDSSQQGLLVKETSGRLIDNVNIWTRRVNELWSIVRADDERRR